MLNHLYLNFENLNNDKLKYQRYVGGLELQTSVWLGEHELNCLTCVSSDSHFPTPESCTTHEFQSTPDD